MTRLLSLSKIRSLKRSKSNNPTQERVAEPQLIGAAHEHLLDEVAQLYWKGVENELKSVLLALKAWQKPELRDVVIPLDHFVHGFDTFVDQVCQDSRQFGARFAASKEETRNQAVDDESSPAQPATRAKSKGAKQKATKETSAKEKTAKEKITKPSRAKSTAENPEGKSKYSTALATVAKDMLAEHRSAQLKLELRESIASNPLNPALNDPKVNDAENLRRRARLLLQALGILDIEKLIQHYPDDDTTSSPRRLAVPQLKLDKVLTAGVLKFAPMKCVECQTVICGSMYRQLVSHIGRLRKSDARICEDCYHLKHRGSPEYIKEYKHCVLPEAIDDRTSRRICFCEAESHYDSRGFGLNLYPVGKKNYHLRTKQEGGLECGLLKLDRVVAEAKFLACQELAGSKPKLVAAGTDGLYNKLRVDESDDENEWVPIAVDNEVPNILQPFSKNITPEPVHTALRIGPVVLEPSMKGKKGEVIFRLRDSPVLHNNYATEDKAMLILREDPEKKLWRVQGPRNRTVRTKAAVKQVIGTAFTGLLDSGTEGRIIDNLIAASRRPFDDVTLEKEEREALISELVREPLAQLQELIKEPLSTYLSTTISRLLDGGTNLSELADAGYHFCERLIDGQTFGSLVPEIQDTAEDPETAGRPLYLMSFLCRPTDIARVKMDSKFDVPLGFTEEYMLRHQSGIYQPSDIIDSLQEYWYDWGAFGDTFYRYQDLFPWDCTEAFGRYPVKCGDSNISKHLWAFPIDSWSLLSLHLCRDRYHYPPPPTNNPNTFAFSEEDWMKNRLTLLAAQEKLTLGAVAMARSRKFRERTAWLHKQPDPKLDRCKLGGIHRGQPFSHYFEQGKYGSYFAAPWSMLNLDGQMDEYLAIRAGRLIAPDVDSARDFYKYELIKPDLEEDIDDNAFADAGDFGHIVTAGNGVPEYNCGSN